MTIPEKTLERVRNLLAKAEATEYEHERETFTSAAAALMAKYGIEQAMLGEREVRSTPTKRRIDMNGETYLSQRMNLLGWLAQAMRCQVVFTTWGRSTCIAHVYGFEADIDRAELMYTSLLLQMRSGLNRLKTPQGENSRAYRNSWIKGFIYQAAMLVKAREEQAKEEAEEVTTGTALVLLGREQQVKALYEAENPNLKSRKYRPSSSRAGWRDGVEAGNRADLGGTGVENRKTELTG